MEFKISYDTDNQYWLLVNDNPNPFAKLCENTRNSAKKDPELVAACRLVKAAPKLMAAAEHIAAILQHPTKSVTTLDQTKLEQAIAEARDGQPDEQTPAPTRAFNMGDTVRKRSGSQWHGTVVGTYSTSLTPEGYAVESATESGSVQIYPAAALEHWTPISGTPGGAQ